MSSDCTVRTLRLWRDCVFLTARKSGFAAGVTLGLQVIFGPLSSDNVPKTAHGLLYRDAKYSPSQVAYSGTTAHGPAVNLVVLQG